MECTIMTMAHNSEIDRRWEGKLREVEMDLSRRRRRVGACPNGTAGVARQALKAGATAGARSWVLVHHTLSTFRAFGSWLSRPRALLMARVGKRAPLSNFWARATQPWWAAAVLSSVTGASS